jgi:hypothetical protein
MTNRSLFQMALLTIGALFVFGCAGPKPYREYSMAYTSLRAAEMSEASRYSPGYWSKAERLYREGEQAYKQNLNSEAKELFIQAQRYAERAENVTRLRKFKSGGAP